MIKKQMPQTPSVSKGKAGQRRLLLIDDLAETLKDDFKDLIPHGYETSIEISPDNAITSINTHAPDVVLLDLHFPGDDLDAGGETSGAKLLGLIQNKFPDLPVVVFTDKMGDDRLSLDTMNPQRYYAKEKIVQLIDTGMDWAADLACTLGQAIADIELTKKSPKELDSEMEFVVGKTHLMKKVVENIRSAAGNTATVLIEGETGTGKELVAKAIHQLSGRVGFTAINCSAVHLETLEARLFGHEKGGFTGADGMKMGLFERTNGGTVFLDEIQAMPESLQSKLIRVVQEKTVERILGKTEIPVDVRLVVATNKPAIELVKEGLLREDLYYRFNTLSITLPSLRQRMEDIPLLWPALIDKANNATGKTVMTILRKEVRELLECHAWPGNIRELENTIFRAVVNAKGNILLAQDIVFDLTSAEFAAQETATARNTGEILQPTFGGKDRVPNHEASEFMDRLNQLPADQRWEYLMANTAGNSRKSVFVEIIHRLKASHPRRRATAKELTEFLCGEEDVSEEEREKFKKNYDKVRTMLSSLDIQITRLDSPQ